MSFILTFLKQLQTGSQLPVAVVVCPLATTDIDETPNTPFPSLPPTVGIISGTPTN